MIARFVLISLVVLAGCNGGSEGSPTLRTPTDASTVEDSGIEIVKDAGNSQDSSPLPTHPLVPVSSKPFPVWKNEQDAGIDSGMHDAGAEILDSGLYDAGVVIDAALIDDAGPPPVLLLEDGGYDYCVYAVQVSTYYDNVCRDEWNPAWLSDCNPFGNSQFCSQADWNTSCHVYWLNSCQEGMSDLADAGCSVAACNSVP